jgi:GTP-binding protein
VSKTPGRTQALNFFALPKGGFIVDLPGYGYAKTARATQMDWGPLLGRYVRERSTLRGVVVLMDIRHPLTELDIGFLQWMVATDKSLLVLLTKCDKVSNSAKVETTRRVRMQIQTQFPALGSRTDVEVFSSLKKTNVEAVSTKIHAWFAPNPAET